MPDVALTRVGTIQNQLLDVVFVHGLGGSGSTTWSSNGNTWPSMMAANRDDVAVWVFDYPAAATKWNVRGDGLDLDELGRQALDYLSSAGLGQRPIVWVAHSLGGLVVKQLLRYALDRQIVDYQPLFEHTVGVVFLATPHSGSQLASLGGVIATLGRLTDTTRDLAVDNPQLEELGRWYRDTAPSAGIATKAYAETLSTRGVMVVGEESADPDVLDCILVPTVEDHISICKPIDTTQPVYVGVNGMLDRLASIAWGIMGDVERSIRELQRTVARVDAYSPDLLRVATPEAAKRLDDALFEISETYKAVKKATKTWVEGTQSTEGVLDAELAAELAVESFADMIHEGRGSCHKIDEIYRADIAPLIDRTAIPDAQKSELHDSFVLFADLDLNLFRRFEEAGEFMQSVAKDIGERRAAGQADEAAALLRETYPTVVHLAASVTRANRALDELRHKLT